MASNDFVMNTQALSNMSDTIKTQAADYLRIIDETTAIVDDLAAHWEGNTYQTFRDGYYAHLGDLEELNSSLKAFAGELDENADSTRRAVSEISSIMGRR